jgi:DNA-binding transcriptional ArsR family regulator
VVVQLHSYSPVVNEWEIVHAAHRFALLSDPTRLRVLHTVMERGELPVHAIAAAARVSRFNASAHLNRLAAGGLLSRRREASSVYYRVEDENLSLICASMCASLHRHGQRRASG